MRTGRSPASLVGQRQQRKPGSEVRPGNREQELLNLIEAAGYKHGEVVNPADFADQLQCKEKTCYIMASKLRAKKLWPYRRQLNSAHAMVRDLVERASGTFDESQITLPESAKRRSENSREACFLKQDFDLGYLHPVYTGDPDYSRDELEFMQAVEDFKSKTNRKFLTTCEYLAIACSLGYRKPCSPKLAERAS